MIDPKINIRSKPALSLIKNNAAITTIADSAVQTRAYELYELRGKIDGRAEQDWYQAENDLRTQQPTSVVDKNVRRTSYQGIA